MNLLNLLSKNFKKLNILNNINVYINNETEKTDEIKHKKKNRILKYDNLKGLGIILVVIFHIMNPFRGELVYDYLAVFIAPIAMTIFFFVSGYFSKIREDSAIRSFRSIFVPYLVFTCLWIVFTIIVFANDVPKTPFLVPARGLWFLLTLFFMRLLLPILIRIRYIFLISILCSLLMSVIDIPYSFLGFGKTVYYLPFFLLGFYFVNSDYYLKKLPPKIRSILIKTKNLIIKNKKSLAVILLLICLFFTSIVYNFPSGFFSIETDYNSLGLGNKIGILMRLFVIIFSIIIILLLNYLMPNKKTILTKLGVNSLIIYVLHFYFVRTLNLFFIDSSFGSLLSSNPILSGLYVIIASASILYILSRDIVANFINRILDSVSNLIIIPYNNTNQ